MPNKETRTVQTLSVAAPAYNEAEGIRVVLASWIEYLGKVPGLTEFEIVICNDGSKDQTGVLLDEMAGQYPVLKPVHHEVNRGAATALTTAIRQTKHSWVLLIDSDGQFAIDTVALLIKAVESTGARAAIGVRVKKHDSIFTKVGSWGSSWLCNYFHGTHYRDFSCALKLVEGTVVRSLLLEAKGLNYSLEVSSKLLECGIAMSEIEVEHMPRLTGRSSAQTLRAAWHRLLFVLFIGIRQLLIRQNVLQVPSTNE